MVRNAEEDTFVIFDDKNRGEKSREGFEDVLFDDELFYTHS